MSAPEKNVLPSQTRATAEIPARERMSASAANKPWREAALIVLTGGLLTLMTAISPSTASVTIRELMKAS